MNVNTWTRVGGSVSRITRSSRYGNRFLTWTKKHPDQWNSTKTILLGIGSAALKPMVFDQAYKNEKQGFTPDERRLLYRQEVIRQAVGTTLWLGGMLASWFISKKFLKNVKKGHEVVHLFNAMLGSTFLDTFVRPVITAKLSKNYKGNHTLPAQPVAHHQQEAHLAVHDMPHSAPHHQQEGLRITPEMSHPPNEGSLPFSNAGYPAAVPYRNGGYYYAYTPTDSRFSAVRWGAPAGSSRFSNRQPVANPIRLSPTPSKVV